MKKFVLFVLILIAILVVGVLVAALVMPNDVTVTRSVVIKASRDSVFRQMVQLRNWSHWNPWLALDTNMKLTYGGTSGEQGSSYSWDSKNDDLGSGTTSITGIQDTKGAKTTSQMQFHIDFVRPMKGTADGVLGARDTAGMVRATWALTLHYSFPFNGLQLFPFMNSEKMVGGAFETGLEKLKAYTEARVVHAPVIPVKEVDYPAHIFEGMRQTVSFNDLMKFFSDSYTALGKEKITDKAAGPAAGIYFTWDTTNKTTDMLAGFPVTDSATRIKGAVFFTQDACKAFNALHKGTYATSMPVHEALAKEVAAKGMTRTMVIEEYLVGPMQEPDSTKWITSIYYLAK